MIETLRCRVMKEKAASVGEQIRSVRNLVRCYFPVIDRPEPQEDGVRTAIAQIFRPLRFGDLRTRLLAFPSTIHWRFAYGKYRK